METKETDKIPYTMISKSIRNKPFQIPLFSRATISSERIF